MSMTEDEITIDISYRWRRENLGLYQKSIGWYLMKMQKHYSAIFANYFDNLQASSENMLSILAYDWALLRWMEDLPGSHPWWFWEPDYYGNTVIDSPMPKPGELEDYPLTITGVWWPGVGKGNFAMMIDTYLHDLNSAWVGDPADFWTSASTTASRNLFEVCKQYLLRHGIAEGTFPPF